MRSRRTNYLRDFAPDVRIDGEPVQTYFRLLFPRCDCRSAPRLRVHRGRTNIAMHDIDEVGVRLGGRMIVHPCAQPWAKQLVRLCRIHLHERHAKVLLRLGIQPLQTGLVHLLPVRGRNPNKKIEKFGRSGIRSSRISLEWRLQNFTESSQRRELPVAKKMRIGLGNRIGNERRYL